MGPPSFFSFFRHPHYPLPDAVFFAHPLPLSGRFREPDRKPEKFFQKELFS